MSTPKRQKTNGGNAVPANGAKAEDFADGANSKAVFQRGISYTYDDIIMHPGHISFPADSVSLAGRVSRHVPLNCPLVSSPMDSVTEGLMALRLALLGGIGIIHYNCSVEE